MLGPGDVLSDRYRLDERLATGGMGEVWRARDLVLARAVAVKVLLPALLADPDFAARFRAEARMMAALRHPGVVQVYDYGESAAAVGSVVYLVMAYVDGEPLSERIAATGRLTPSETMSAVAHAADALQAVHAVGIVHRDVKPANLLVQPDGTVVLVDFGVAHDVAATRLTGTNMVLGTALYMAPEQVSGRPVSAATDIYALGAVAYHCLAGHPPFSGGTALEVAGRHLHDEPPPLPDDVPAPVRALVGQALAKEPAARYPSAAALAAAARATGTGPAEALTALTATAGAAARTDPDPVTLSGVNVVAVPSARPARSRRRLTAVAAVAVTLLFALAAVVAVSRFGSDPRAPSPAGPPSSATPAATTPAQPGSTRSNPAAQSAAPIPSPAASVRSTSRPPAPTASATTPTASATAPTPAPTASATVSTAG